jgi:hypothetical protein
MNILIILSFAVVTFIVLFYLFLQVKEKLELNKLRRKYDREQDPSRKGEPTIAGATSSDNNGKPNDNESVVADKREVEPVDTAKRGRPKKPVVVPLEVLQEEIKSGEPTNTAETNKTN